MIAFGESVVGVYAELLIDLTIQFFYQVYVM
jgi:hypothetical protein